MTWQSTKHQAVSNLEAYSVDSIHYDLPDRIPGKWSQSLSNEHRDCHLGGTSSFR